MVCSAAAGDDRTMMQQDEPSTPAIALPDDTQEAVVRYLRRRLDQREETIRELNEALSAALDELERTGKLAA